MNFPKIKLISNALLNPRSNRIKDTSFPVTQTFWRGTIFGWKIKYKKLSRKNKKRSTRDSNSAPLLLKLTKNLNEPNPTNSRIKSIGKRARTINYTNQPFDPIKLGMNISNRCQRLPSHPKKCHMSISIGRSK